ncbi:uncharacterized protein LOC129760672 [Uranotaenia lowii]|uniref:uncharacterized protein LOC129760672 n=1 Tax=Uranotaenia lowii TaxID=190385 RepID=UPI00247AC66B|nr:uncharacterized protein LOC129760672 [Uranotaenia lowii]
MEKWEVPQFKFKHFPRNSIRNEWLKYKRNFEFIVAASGETDKTRIKNIFLAKAGPDLQEIFLSIPGADVQEDEEETIDPFKVAISKLDTYFALKQHDAFERNLFWILIPNADESLEKFMLRCQDQAGKCNFGKTAEESKSISVIDKVILFAPNDLKEQLLQKDTLDIDFVTRMVNSYESVKHQAQCMNLSGTNASVNENFYPGSVSGINKLLCSEESECSRCGNKDHTGNSKDCPAVNKDCRKCGRFGHFAIKCRTASYKRKPDTRPKRTFLSGKRPKIERVRWIEHKKDGEDDRNFIFSISDGDDFMWLILIDSGCKKNIVDERSWKYLKANGISVENQSTECSEIFLPYGSAAKPLTVLGKFDATVSV